MKVLIASDKFKGTLTAKEVADLISEGLSDHECVLKPVADGGEGTSDILGHSLGVSTFEVSVQGLMEVVFPHQLKLHWIRMGFQK